MRPRAEVVLVKAPRECAVMDGAATCLVAIIQNRERVRAYIRVRPPSDGMALHVGAQLLPLEVAQFIVRGEVRRGKPRTALQADDFHPGFARLGREYPSCRTNTDDDHSRLLNCHGSSLPLWAC